MKCETGGSAERPLQYIQRVTRIPGELEYSSLFLAQ